MKRILFILLLVVIGQSIKAQKTIVGTGNTTNGKTGSDNSSTLWKSSSTRKWIYNTSDSIGIGTSTPDSRLEVIGNVKTSGRIDARGVVEAAGLSSSGVLYINKTSLLEGDVTAHSDLSVSGDVTTNSGITINNSGATMQLTTSGINKGFFQIAGDNVRTGTNSGNENGKFIIRNNGADRIAIEADGKLTTPATGDNNSMIPLCYGVVSDQGVLKRGTANVTVTKVAAAGLLGDHYQISCPGITSNSIIIATPEFLSTCDISARCVSGAAEVYTYFRNPNLDFRYLAFSFIIYK